MQWGCKIEVVLLLLGMLSGLLGCCIEGSGQVEAREVFVESFGAIFVEVPSTIHVYAGEEAALSIKTDKNIHSHIQTTVENERLHIRFASDDCCVAPTELQIYVTTQC